MTCDYALIRAENERRYGTDIGRIGPMLLADRYAERTHFIYELLQNAEDALVRRGPEWNGPREVSFRLDGRALRVSHYGAPFDERDVRGICGIAEGQKERRDIGRFGIGFKSVYAFADRPEVHSGGEDFLIDNYVWPAAAAPIETKGDETVFLLPLRPEDCSAVVEITAGLRRLGPRVLLFLRAIEGISWSVQDGPSGHYLRGKPARASDKARRLELAWQEGPDDPPADETWLVFSRPVHPQDGETVGYVEVAFRLDRQEDKEVVRPVTESPLVVFFPTVLETHLGFLVQGPYRTTPSRDNVPQDDRNKDLVRETGALLVDALRTLREMNLLDADALRVLPLVRSRFSEGNMFAPLFEAARHALRSEPLLPCFGGGHVAACHAKLAGTQELRELFGASQLAALFDHERGLAWLSGDITKDRAPELRQYLIQELEIAEITPETILPRLGKPFLEAQSDEWVVSLYEFLTGQRALHRRLEEVPLVRLADGTHVKPRNADGQGQAFLPGRADTGFPTVKASVCCTDGAREFLKSLGLREPDPVDDVVVNVLPKYKPGQVSIGDEEYAADIRRILRAFATDSKGQQERLIGALKETPFAMAVDAGDGSKRLAKVGEVYLATERLKELFAGVGGVLLVDDAYPSLRGEDARELLEACGGLRHLRAVEDRSLSREERSKLRRNAGHAETSGQNDRIADWMLSGLERLLETLPGVATDERARKAKLLWEELAHLEERRGKGLFSGEYTWTHYGSYRARFDAAFVRRLNEAPWVPGADGTLHPPGSVLFEETGWTANPFLLSKIRFNPPVLEQLAKAAGIEPGVIALLKTLGIRTEEQLRARVGIKETAEGDTLGIPPGDGQGGTPTTSSGRDEVAPPGSGSRGAGDGGTSPPGSRNDDKGRRQFVSYVAVHPNDEDPDPDELDQQARMELEEKAIQFILQREPQLHRTSTHNPGYDLFETGDGERTIRWVEVKAMTRSLIEFRKSNGAELTIYAA